MLIIDSKDCENIDKALKKYKKKFEKSKVLLQLRERQSYMKPSVRRRGQILKAIYKQNIASGKIEGLALGVVIGFTESDPAVCGESNPAASWRFNQGDVVEVIAKCSRDGNAANWLHLF